MPAGRSSVQSDINGRLALSCSSFAAIGGLQSDHHELLKLLERWRAEAEKAGHKITRIAVASPRALSDTPQWPGRRSAPFRFDLAKLFHEHGRMGSISKWPALAHELRPEVGLDPDQLVTGPLRTCAVADH